MMIYLCVKFDGDINQETVATFSWGHFEISKFDWPVWVTIDLCVITMPISDKSCEQVQCYEKKRIIRTSYTVFVWMLTQKSPKGIQD